MGERLPLFPLGTVLFPGMLLPLHLFEERYRRLMEERQGASPVFGVVLTRQGREVGDQPAVHGVGTAAELLGAGRYPDGRYDVVVRGERRFQIGDEDWSRGYLTAEVGWLDDGVASAAAGADRLGQRVSRAYEGFLAAFERTAGVEVPRDELPGDPAALAYAICARVPLDTWERQALLEEATTERRLERLAATLRRERELLLETGAGGATVERAGARFTAN
jgi:Lon protease-like protein